MTHLQGETGRNRGDRSNPDSGVSGMNLRSKLLLGIGYCAHHHVLPRGSVLIHLSGTELPDPGKPGNPEGCGEYCRSSRNRYKKYLFDRPAITRSGRKPTGLCRTRIRTGSIRTWEMIFSNGLTSTSITFCSTTAQTISYTGRDMIPFPRRVFRCRRPWQAT